MNSNRRVAAQHGQSIGVWVRIHLPYVLAAPRQQERSEISVRAQGSLPSAQKVGLRRDILVQGKLSYHA